MASNFPGPYTLDYLYTVSGIQHRMSTNLAMTIVGQIGDPFTAWTIANRSAAPITLKVYSDALIALLQPFFEIPTTFDTATLYSVTPLTFDKIWLGEESIGLVGTHAGAAVLSQQRIWTLRTVEGGVAKIVLMEAANLTDHQISEAAYGPLSLALTNYVKHVDSGMLGRDTSYLIGNIRESDGQNEKTWRQRNRP